MSMIKIMLDSFGIDANELQTTAKQLQEFYNTVQRVEKKLDIVLREMGYNDDGINAINDQLTAQEDNNNAR